MPSVLFKDTTYSVQGLVEDIGKGTIALPDIQRPFVWPATKVRDLLDSMYKGFPVGYLLFWETGAETGMRQIGVESKERAARLLIVDGQQRLTSLYSVMSGTPILKADYSQSRIRIAFRPMDRTFAVADAATDRDAEFVSDISVLWQPGEYRNSLRAFIRRLREKREVSETELDSLEEAVDRVRDLRDYPFKAVELGVDVDEEQVAEVFVRINSEGVTLNQADFILTLMSVFWEDGRKELERFSREGKVPSKGASSFNWFIEPSPAQMLRVSVALAFRRAVLRHVYSLLRGKDLETGKIDAATRTAQFESLQRSQAKALDLTNWHEFLQCLERAGHRGSKMISSEHTLLFSYSLWLIGKVDFKVPLDQLRELMARWFFMAHMTGRYTGSFESRFEQDVARLRDVGKGDSAGFVTTLTKIIDDTLTQDYWAITLPNDLATSASKSPALLAYIAALNIMDADALLSTDKLRIRLDPAVTSRKGIERHHLFPQAYLKRVLKIQDNKQINQIANMALLVWWDNIEISDESPAEYWPKQLEKKGLSDAVLARQEYLHALPEGWQHLEYESFLEQRRRLMAAVVRDAFAELSKSAYAPNYPPAGSYVPTGDTPNADPQSVTLVDLLAAGMLAPGAMLSGRRADTQAEATVLADGRILFDGETYQTLSGAACAATGKSTNGWTFWRVDVDGDSKRLSRLRREFLGEFDSGDPAEEGPSEGQRS